MDEAEERPPARPPLLAATTLFDPKSIESWARAASGEITLERSTAEAMAEADTIFPKSGFISRAVVIWEDAVVGAKALLVEKPAAATTARRTCFNIFNIFCDD
jgi:hypothetical protein